MPRGRPLPKAHSCWHRPRRSRQLSLATRSRSPVAPHPAVVGARSTSAPRRRGNEHRAIQAPHARGVKRIEMFHVERVHGTRHLFHVEHGVAVGPQPHVPRGTWGPDLEERTLCRDSDPPGIPGRTWPRSVDRDEIPPGCDMRSRSQPELREPLRRPSGCRFLGIRWLGDKEEGVGGEESRGALRSGCGSGEGSGCDQLEPSLQVRLAGCVLRSGAANSHPIRDAKLVCRPQEEVAAPTDRVEQHAGCPGPPGREDEAGHAAT